MPPHTIHGPTTTRRAGRHGRRRIVACALGVLLQALCACTQRLDWREVASPAGHFVVAMPDRPQTVQRAVDYPGAGGPVRLAVTMTSSGVGATLFAVGVAELPPPQAGDPQAVVAWFRDALARNIGGTAGPARVLGAPRGAGTAALAEEFVARGTIGPERRAGRLVMRFYRVDDRLYMVTALAADGELPDEALETFQESFRLTE